VGDLEAGVDHHFLEFVFVGGLSEVDGGEVLQVGLEDAQDLLEGSLLLVEGHEEVDSAVGGEVVLRDLEGLLPVGHQHEGAGEDDDIVLLLALGDEVVIHLLDFDVLVGGEDLLRGDDVVAVDVDAGHLSVLGHLVDDGVEGVASADSHVQHLSDLLLGHFPSGGHSFIRITCEVFRIDFIIYEDWDVGQSQSEIEEDLRDQFGDETDGACHFWFIFF